MKQEQSIIRDLDQYIQRFNDFKSSTTVQQFTERIKLLKDHSTQQILLQINSHYSTSWWLVTEDTMMDLGKLLKVLF